MRPSGIGGQAVMEGVMMKNKETYAVAVRKPDKEIVVDVQTYGDKSKFKALRKIPFVRGVFNFIDSLVLGTKVLTYSAGFFEEEEEKDAKEEKEEKETKEEGNRKEEKDEKGAKTEEGSGKDSLFMGLTVAFSLILSIGIFFCLPWGITELARRFVTRNQWVLSILEGLIRIVIFIAYIVLISFMDDIQRFFMYHGAEHKCINCIEQGMALTVENARESSRFHKRCGTSFLLIVMVISIVFLFFIQAESRLLRLVIRLALIPVIAGISYEFIRLAGRSENKIVCMLSKPGMWLQKLTTREPEDDMLEVAIASVEAVFDWRAFLKEESGGKNEKNQAKTGCD